MVLIAGQRLKERGPIQSKNNCSPEISTNLIFASQITLKSHENYPSFTSGKSFPKIKTLASPL